MPKFIYFGTPVFSTFVLDELARAGFLPVAVVTTPDKPAGRGLTLTASPVKAWAIAKDIPVLQPERFDEETVGKLRTYGADLFVVAAYGKILPKRILAIPPQGSLNVHPSLLPKYRGMSPVESQIRADEKNVGVSIILMDEQMDHGPLVAQETIDTTDWPVSRNVLNERLWKAGGALLAKSIPDFIAGRITLVPQDHTQTTLTKKITKEDGLIDLTADGRENYLKYLAYEGWPGTYFFVERNGVPLRVKIQTAQFENGIFMPLRIVPEGKGPMDFSTLG